MCGWNLHFSSLLVYISDTCCAHTADLVFVVSPVPFSLQIMIFHHAITLIVSRVLMFCTCLPPPFCVSTMYSIVQCGWTFLCQRLPISPLCLYLTTLIALIAFQMFWSHVILIPNFPALFYSSHPVALPSCTSQPHSHPIYLAYFPQFSGSSRQSEFCIFTWLEVHSAGTFSPCASNVSVSTRKRY